MSRSGMFDSLRRLEVRSLESEAVTVSPESPISKIIGILRDLRVYEVFIPLDGKIGMVTTRDMLKATNITTRKTSSLISFVPKLSPHTKVGEAARLMTDYRIRALPIVEDDEFEGVITALSIVKQTKDLPIKEIRAGSIMSPHPITVSRDDIASKARSLMIRRRIDHLPVLQHNRVYGIVTSSHILFRMLPSVAVERGALGAEKQVRLNFPVDRILDKSLQICNVNDKLTTVLDQIVETRSTYCIATLWDEIHGIITYRDIVKLVAYEQESQDIPIYMIGLPDDPFEAEIARIKFTRTIATLRKSIAEILEARSIIKSADEGGERRRYEVDVTIRTPYRSFVYSETGWELPAIYDIITDRMKRLLSQRPLKKATRTMRRPEGI